MTAVKNNNAKTKLRNQKSWALSKERHALHRAENEALHDAKVANGGLGARELRRIEAGIRKQPDAAELSAIKSKPSRGSRRRALKRSNAVLAAAADSPTVKKDRRRNK